MSFGQGKVWVDGKLVPWADANISMMSHVVHYGSCVFGGMRCYKTDKGPAIFRTADHVKRLYESARIYRMDVPYSQEEYAEAIRETIRANGYESCYMRPFIFRGYGALGVNPTTCPVVCAVAAWEWGAYLGDEGLEKGVSICVSSWRRPAPNTFPTLAKAGGNYLNSQLIKLEAMEDGYDEGLALDPNGYVSECSGQNIFVVRNGQIYTPPTSSQILAGITRHTVFTLAKELGYRVVSHLVPREALYIADEVFLTGTAAEVTPVAKVDGMTVGNGARGPITTKIQSAFFDTVNGRREDKHGWLDYI